MHRREFVFSAGAALSAATLGARFLARLVPALRLFGARLPFLTGDLPILWPLGARRALGPPTLSVAVIPSVAICWLIPRLSDFQARSPGTDLRIVYAIHGKDSDFSDADVAVIFSGGEPAMAGFAATRLLDGASAPVCSRAFAEAHGPLDHVHYLRGSEAVMQARLVSKSPAILTIRASAETRAITSEWRAVIDAVIFDPPRAGARAQSVQLAESAVPTVVGVSCNPATFARDARTLVDGGYRLERVTPIDQFLWSSHVELVGVFRR